MPGIFYFVQQSRKFMAHLLVRPGRILAGGPAVIAPGTVRDPVAFLSPRL